MATDQQSVDERNFLNNLPEPITPIAPQKPFVSKFKITVCNPMKDGESLTYRVKSILLDSNIDNKREEFVVLRVYEEIEAFHLNLRNNADTAGIILPPLPKRPNLNAHSAIQSSRKQLGSRSKILMGDSFNKDCRALQKYLSLMANHWWFGDSNELKDFLCVQNFSTSHIVRSGMLNRINTVIETTRRSNRRDVDEIFQAERNKINQYYNNITDTVTAFQEMLNAQLRVSAAYNHLSTVLIMGGRYLDENTLHSNRLLVRFSETINDAKHGNDVDIMNNDNTLGFHLLFAQSYTEAVQEMHSQRISLLIDYEEANRLLEKAKPHRRQAAEDIKLRIQRQCENSSERARREIVRYKEYHVISMQEALCMYAEAKVKTARDTYALLAKSLTHFKQLKI